MKITTAVQIPAPPSAVFPLLHGSRMPLRAPFLRLLGLEPRACRLLSAPGAGAHRQCQTDSGAIDQHVTEWVEDELLAFRVTHEDVGLRSWVSSLDDRFTLEATPGGTLLTRTTRLTLRGIFKPIKALLVYAILKRIHIFVFENWRTLAGVSPVEAGAPAS